MNKISRNITVKQVMEINFKNNNNNNLVNYYNKTCELYLQIIKIEFLYIF